MPRPPHLRALRRAAGPRDGAAAARVARGGGPFAVRLVLERAVAGHNGRLLRGPLLPGPRDVRARAGRGDAARVRGDRGDRPTAADRLPRPRHGPPHAPRRPERRGLPRRRGGERRGAQLCAREHPDGAGPHPRVLGQLRRPAPPRHRRGRDLAGGRQGQGEVHPHRGGQPAARAGRQGLRGRVRARPLRGAKGYCPWCDRHDRRAGRAPRPRRRAAAPLRQGGWPPVARHCRDGLRDGDHRKVVRHHVRHRVAQARGARRGRRARHQDAPRGVCARPDARAQAEPDAFPRRGHLRRGERRAVGARRRAAAAHLLHRPLRRVGGQGRRGDGGGGL
mmetsp:Transcript_19969/g.63634  ORF Transcript_19969/g.63634 Transcript_19969/m.63634 type:complete len:335 (-) Transcript_19969:208-1212(-)